MKHGMIALLGVSALAPSAVFAAPSQEVVQTDKQPQAATQEASSETIAQWLGMDWDISLDNLIYGVYTQTDIQGPPIKIQ